MGVPPRWPRERQGLRPWTRPKQGCLYERFPDHWMRKSKACEEHVDTALSPFLRKNEPPPTLPCGAMHRRGITLRGLGPLNEDFNSEIRGAEWFLKGYPKYKHLPHYDIIQRPHETICLPSDWWHTPHRPGIEEPRQGTAQEVYLLSDDLLVNFCATISFSLFRAGEPPRALAADSLPGTGEGSKSGFSCCRRACGRARLSPACWSARSSVQFREPGARRRVGMCKDVLVSEQFWMYLNLDMVAPQTLARTFTKPGFRLY